MKNRIIELLDGLNIEYRWIYHPAVFTVAESTQHLEGKTPIKNLLLRDKDERTILVIMAGEQRLDTKLVAEKLGTRKLQFAGPHILKEVLDVTPGAVSIFGLLNKDSKDVEVVIDQALLKEPELGFHPNDNTSTIFIPGSALESIIIQTGHKYQILKLY